ncbi:phosphatase PAP2 family protein [Chitinophagaceae bacterium MMS25-I14]
MEKKAQFRVGTKRVTVLISFLCVFCFNCRAQSLDVKLLRDINGTEHVKPMYDISQTIYPATITVVAGELIYGYASGDKEARQQAWQLTAGVGLNLAVSFGLKYAVNRPRPYVSNNDITPYRTASDPSFPSGHTSEAFALATALSMQHPKWYVITPAFLYAGAVGYSRMYLGVHYPSDVLAGALIGAGSAWAGKKGMQWLQHRKHKNVPQTPF